MTTNPAAVLVEVEAVRAICIGGRPLAAGHKTTVPAIDAAGLVEDGSATLTDPRQMALLNEARRAYNARACAPQQSRGWPPSSGRINT